MMDFDRIALIHLFLRYVIRMVVPYISEYHIECYWSFWPMFREAIRDIWPVRQAVRGE
jgi:hypothetical protein